MLKNVQPFKPTNISEFSIKMDEHITLSKNSGESNRHLYSIKIEGTIALGIADFIYKYVWEYTNAL